ncbi:hypothetical protein [Marinicella meishanensis]|uniref:hypothetical protein n=1 Tax=Marinicella meishanensis TaxID=2873263 RepID=UPI001CBC37B6|nr:hypothetical protein [Marinicella sp. NBU2979]
MKFFLSGLLGLLLSTQLWSADFQAELTSEALEGAWLITHMGGEVDEEGDLWEFEKGLFYQNLGGRRIAPDKYTVKGEVVDLDGYHITVLAFDGKTMRADMAGFEYQLVKQ